MLKLLLFITALLAFLSSLSISIYLHLCRFRGGRGVIATLTLGWEKCKEVLSVFLTAFSIFNSIQLGIMLVSFTFLPNNFEVIFWGILGFITYFIGLFYTLTFLLISSIGGQKIPHYHFSILMLILGIGITLTILLLRAIIIL